MEGSRPAIPVSSMGLGRLELPTSRLSGVRSNHLSYRPLDLLTSVSTGTYGPHCQGSLLFVFGRGAPTGPHSTRRVRP